jgi:hypothetical protein
LADKDRGSLPATNRWSPPVTNTLIGTEANKWWICSMMVVGWSDPTGIHTKARECQKQKNRDVLQST